MSKANAKAITKPRTDKSELVKKDAGEDARVFSEHVGGYTLAHMLGLPEEDLVRVGQALMDQVVGGVGTRDPLERMLIEQLAWTYQRVQALSLLAVSTTDPAHQLALHQQCDKAMNAYRRGMLALKEYRGVKQRTPYVAIQQINESEPGNVVISPGSGSPATNKEVMNEVGAKGGN